MLQFPVEWAQHFGINLTTAYPPSGGGRFRYYERLSPLPSFSQIVNQMLASDPLFRVHHVGDMLRTVTGEGEYGAWVSIAGQREGSAAMRYVGAVFLDDFAAALDCIVLTPDRFEEFELRSQELLYLTKFGLSRRTRPYFYQPPTNWQGIPSGLVANFYPIDFPRNLTNIVVHPATFLETDESRAIVDAFTQGSSGLSIERSSRDEITSNDGIKGAYLRLQGRRPKVPELIYRELAVFIVHSYAYQMRFETTNEAALPELRTLFRSIASSFQPLPSPQEVRLGRSFVVEEDTILGHWAS